MKLRRLTRAGRRRAAVDDVLVAYSSWKRESAAVRAAYRKWVRAARSDACVAFAAYRVALDREQQAADSYARMLPRAKYRPDLAVARQLAHLTAQFETV